MLTISNSRINLFRNCHYAHYLKYVKNLEKKTKAGPLQRGSIIHECIELHNKGEKWEPALKKFSTEFYKTTFKEEIVEMGDIPKMVQELLENYFHHYAKESITYLKNELHFTLPLIKGVEIEGYIDAVIKDGSKRTWGMETKTYSKTPDRDFLMFNGQSALYTWAMEQLEYKPEGMLWNVIKAKEPTKPKMTEKTKKLSLAKLDSTPYTIIKGIKELGLNPKDYTEFINNHDYESYLYRHFIRINKSVTKFIMEDVKSTAQNILDSGETIKDRNLSKNCSWCSFKEICQAELMGLDTDYIIKSEYKIREKGGKKDEKEKGKIKTARGNRK